MKCEEPLVKKWLPCPLWDFPGLQDWLNEQAQAGYALEKFPGFSFIGKVVFRKDPSAVHARYCLDPMQEHLGIGKLREQAAVYRDLGWHYVDKIGNRYAIYRCDDPEAPDLYNDPDSLCWSMKKQVRWAWIGLFFWLVWAAVLFRDEWYALFHWPTEFVMDLILHAEVLIPFYAIMLALVLNSLLQGISIFRGVRRIQASLRRGEWPTPRPRRYPELCRSLMTWIAAGVFVLFLLYLGISGIMHTKTLSGPEEWDFPHVTLEEVLPAGANFRPYNHREMLPSDTLDRSLLAPEQYDVAQGGTVRMDGRPQQDTRLYQESVRTLSPSLAQWVYRGRVTAHRHSLEKYRTNWEKNTSTLHPDLPNAYDNLREEELSYPGLDGLTRFTYQYSDKTTPSTVYIGWAGNRVFVLNCSGAADSEAALALLVQRLSTP